MINALTSEAREMLTDRKSIEDLETSKEEAQEIEGQEIEGRVSEVVVHVQVVHLTGKPVARGHRIFDRKVSSLNPVERFKSRVMPKEEVFDQAAQWQQEMFGAQR